MNVSCRLLEQFVAGTIQGCLPQTPLRRQVAESCFRV
jgi:hypothetical protein